MGALPTTRRSPPSISSDPQSAENFDTLYKDHVDLMYRFAHRLCGEPESAKDLVQETFLNAYRGLDRFRGDAQISTWLYTIASRACLRMRRRRKGAPERELSLDEFIPTSDGEFRLQIPIDGLSPEEALQNKQLRQALDDAINQLPKKYKMVLVLRDMEGLSAKEVGSVMGLNERAVKSRLHRARLFVRRQLSARGLGETSGDHDSLGWRKD
ncbi:MAG: RNA polymerase subunit sigma-24 [Nitrospira sp. LK265]|nr:sigma-70 family RNA polymerase sigma factor [Nitrospira sp.]NGZ59639.1 RNA polymerase subunit sigma-24 [Nitrospira sp. LK265]